MNFRSLLFLSRNVRSGRTFFSTHNFSRMMSQSPQGPEEINPTFTSLKQDWKEMIQRRTEDRGGVPHHVDILVVGGGIMGTSIAYWLKQRAPESFELMIIERDPTYTRSSSALSVGGIRQQFSIPENIQLSLASSQFLRNVRKHLSVLDQDLPDIRFQHHGYLFLASDKGAGQLKDNFKVQEECGSKIELMTPAMLKAKFPWINTEGVTLGAYGLENEGWFDPWSLLSAFRMKAVSLGTKYLKAEVRGFNFKEIQSMYVEETNEPYQTVNTAIVKTPDGKEREISFSILVVAAGAHSGEVGRMLRIGTGRGILQKPIPVEPRFITQKSLVPEAKADKKKRYVYVYHCNDGPGIECPLLIDPSGVYFRREGLGGNYVGGKSPSEDEEPDVENLDVDYTFFDKHVWPTLAERVPAFEAIKLTSAWAGYYDYNTLDQNAIIGLHPYYSNVYFATGFSGHGIQMAPAVGRAVMELILEHQYKTIDLHRFGLERIVSNKPIYESNIV